MEITMKFEQKYSITSLREDNNSLIKGGYYVFSIPDP